MAELALNPRLRLPYWFARAIAVNEGPQDAASLGPVRGCYCAECCFSRRETRLAFETYLREVA